MKTKQQLTAATLLLVASSHSAGLFAEEAPYYYDNYFVPASAATIFDQTALYNEENGYWSDRHANSELVRYLLAMEQAEKEAYLAKNEENGFW